MKPARIVRGAAISPALGPIALRRRHVDVGARGRAAVVIPYESCIGLPSDSLNSCMWLCISHRPGITVLPEASMIVAPAGTLTESSGPDSHDPVAADDDGGSGAHDSAFAVEDVAVDDGDRSRRRLHEPPIHRLGLRVAKFSFDFAQRRQRRLGTRFDGDEPADLGRQQSRRCRRARPSRGVSVVPR